MPSLCLCCSQQGCKQLHTQQAEHLLATCPSQYSQGRSRVPVGKPVWLNLAPHMPALTCKCCHHPSNTRATASCHSLGGLDSSGKRCRNRSIDAQQKGDPQHQPCTQSAGKGRWVCVIDSLRVAKGAIADRALVAVAVEVHSWRLGAGGCPGLLPADDRDERCWQRGMPPDVPAATLGDKPRGRQTKQQCSR